MRLQAILPTIVYLAVTIGCSSVDPDLPRVFPLTPPDGGVADGAVVELGWSDAPDAETYRLQVGLAPEISRGLVVEERTVDAPRAVIDGALPDTVYYWRVRYRTVSRRWSEWSGPWRFGTFSGIPRMTGPNAGAYLFKKRPKFSWSRVDPAESYDLEVSLSAGFDGPAAVSREKIETTQYGVETALDRGAVYYWRVRARFPGDVAGRWSGPSSFELVDAWIRSYGFYERDIDFKAYALAATDAGVVVGGTLRAPGRADIIVTSLDSEGGVLSAFAGNLRQYDELVSLDYQSGVLFSAANIGSDEEPSGGVWIAAVDEAGVVSQTVLVSDGPPTVSSLAALADGGCVLAGERRRSDDDSADGWIARLDSGLTPLWAFAHDVGSNDTLSAVVVVDESIVCVGRVDTDDSAGAALWVMKLDVADGRLVWQYLYDSVREDLPGGA